mgnify:CR=1 FL=1
MAWVFVSDTKFYLHDNETLLAGLQRQGVDIPFQCQAGYCGTCKLKHAKLNNKTTVHYLNEPLFMLEEDELLACCCHVEGVLALHLA